MNRFSKRLFDLLLSILLIIVTFPLQLLIGFILWIELKENPIFLQERALSLDRNHFRLIKFRTIKKKFSTEIIHDENPQRFLIRDFAFNITPFASWIRKTGLDELLQFYNVLIGQMSIIGPRPLMKEELIIIHEKFYEQHCIRNALKSKPGITGVWQLIGDRKLGVENLIGLDLFYEENNSVKLDLKILSFTLMVIFHSKSLKSLSPRIYSVGKINSLSNYKLIIDHGRYFQDNKQRIKTYSLCMPEDWWYENNSYFRNNSSAQDRVDILEKNQWGDKIFNN